MKNNTEISPLQALERAIRYWWLIAGLGLLGGLLGWLFSRMMPPVYESGAILAISLLETELAPADQLPMTYAEQENYLGPVEALLTSPTVREKLEAAATAQGIAFNATGFTAPDYRIERIKERWRLIVRAPDPLAASALADLWADAALETIVETNDHAINAERSRLEEVLLRHCIETGDLEDVNACAGTSFSSLLEMNARLDELELRYAEEKEASQGITPALEFEFVKKAPVPDAAVLNARTFLLLAGTALGLLAGLILGISLPARKIQPHVSVQK
jgi:hypothetical protein